jgi:hypothetical protein
VADPAHLREVAEVYRTAERHPNDPAGVAAARVEATRMPA